MGKKKRRETETDSDFRGAIRVARLLIVKEDEGRPEAWFKQATVMQRVANATWFAWRAWHVQQGDDQRIFTWMNDLLAYRRAEQAVHERHGQQEGEPSLSKKELRLRTEAAKAEVRATLGEVPTCPVMCWPNECRNYVYGIIGRSFAEVPKATVAYAQNMLVGDMNKRPASNSSWKKWHRVLANYGEMPNYSHPEPIPLRPDDVEIIPPSDPLDDEAAWCLRFLGERREEGGRGRNVSDVVEVATKGKRLHGLRRVLRGCLTGDLKQRGGSVVRHRGKWYLHLCYQERKLETADVDPKRVAILEPAIEHPWSLWVPDGREIWVKGWGKTVEYHRRNIVTATATKKDSKAGRRSRGHGRRGRLFESRFDGFKKTFNEQSVAQVTRILLEKGCGTIVFRRPGEKTGEKTFLASAGAGSRGDSWPWHQVATLLERVPWLKVSVANWEPPESDNDGEGCGGEKTAGTARGNGSRGGGKTCGNGKAEGRRVNAENGSAEKDRSKNGSQRAGK